MKTTLLFPGQGIRFLELSNSTNRKSEPFAAMLAKTDNILQLDLSGRLAAGDEAILMRTEYLQPLLFALEMAAYESFTQQTGDIPAFALGQSLGELSALCASGVFTFEDGVMLIGQRSRAMQSAALAKPGNMAAIVGVDMERLQAICDDVSTVHEPLIISNWNASKHFTISGDNAALARALAEMARIEEANCFPLNTGAAFHSTYMNEAAGKVAEALERITLHESRFPVISNTIARPYGSIADVKTLLIKHITSPVLLYPSIQYVVDNGSDLIIDMGPGKSMLRMLQAQQLNIPIEAYEERYKKIAQQKFSERDASPITLENAVHFIRRCQAVAVSTRNSNWNEDEYDQGVVRPYAQLQKSWEEIILHNENYRNEITQAHALLKVILDTKKVDENEQRERICALYEEIGLTPENGLLHK